MCHRYIFYTKYISSELNNHLFEWKKKNSCMPLTGTMVDPTCRRHINVISLIRWSTGGI